MIQLCIYINMFFFTFLSITVYSRIVNIVPCAPHWDLVVYPSYICLSASAIPKLPHLPSSSPSPLATKSLISASVSQFLFHRQVCLCHTKKKNNLVNKWMTSFLDFALFIHLVSFLTTPCGR